MCCMYREGDSSISEETEENLLGVSGTSSVINEKHKSTLIPSMNDCNNKKDWRKYILLLASTII